MAKKITGIREEDLRNYELMVIIVPNISDEKIAKELDKIRELIKSYKGKISNEDLWGKRDLAYKIRGLDTGYYAVLNFEADKQLMKELTKTLNIEINVLRFLVSKLPNDYVLKPLAEYEKEAEKEKQEKEAAKEKETKARMARKPAAKAPVKAAAPKTTKAAPATEAPEKKKGASLKELDEKLKSIIDDTDIAL